MDIWVYSVLNAGNLGGELGDTLRMFVSIEVM
jgi:hypothetical protein